MRLIGMDANELLVQELQAKLERTEAKIHELSSHHSAVTEQFSQTIDEKNHQIALLEQKIKRLLSNVKGSRQERINPDQLLLLSPEELNMLSQELESQAAQEEAEQADTSATGEQKNPSQLVVEIYQAIFHVKYVATNSPKNNANALAAAIPAKRWVLSPANNSSSYRQSSKSSNINASNTLARTAKKTSLSPTSHLSRSKRAFQVQVFVPTSFFLNSETIFRYIAKKISLIAWAGTCEEARSASGLER